MTGLGGRDDEGGLDDTTRSHGKGKKVGKVYKGLKWRVRSTQFKGWSVYDPIPTFLSANVMIF